MNATVGNDDVWIGLSDTEREGQFLWLDGELATNGAIGWADGEPNDEISREDCVHINLADGFRHNEANDKPCDDAVHALCEKKLVTNSSFGCI